MCKDNINYSNFKVKQEYYLFFNHFIKIMNKNTPAIINNRLNVCKLIKENENIVPNQ